MSMSTTQWDHLIASRSAYVKSVMVDEYNKRKQMFPMLFNMENSDRYSEVLHEEASLGMASAIDGELPEAWPTDDFKHRYTKAFIHAWYGLQIQFTKPFLMNDVDRLGPRRSRALMTAGLNTQEYWASRIFVNMTATGDYALPDTKALAATDHPLPLNVLGTATTASNYINATLDHDSLQDMLTNMDTMVNERGFPIASPMTRLVVAPANAPLASEIRNSTQRHDTTENAVNVIGRDYNFEIVPWHFIQSATFWAGQAADHQLYWFTRQGIQERTNEDFDNYGITAKIDFFFSSGAFGWRGFVGGTT